jgi:hypothetical protein
MSTGSVPAGWVPDGVFSVTTTVVSAEPHAEERAIDASATPPATIPASLRNSLRDRIILSVLSVPTSFTPEKILAIFI